MLATFVIGLREGLEAALIVGIVAAFLKRNGKSLVPLWIGVAVAVILSALVGIALKVVESSLPQDKQEAMETVIGVIAVVFVTGMVFWMSTNSRGLKGELEAAAGDALADGTSRALAVMAFLAVLKEGFETAVFLLATFQAASNVATAATGAVLGVAAAVVLGVGLYRGGVKINLSKFFRITGVFLVLVAAGLVVTALRTAHEAGWLNSGQQKTFDLSWLAANGSVRGALLTGVLGIPAEPRLVEVLGWLLYIIPICAYLYWPQRLRLGTRVTTRLQQAGAALSLILAAALFWGVPQASADIPEKTPLTPSGSASISGTTLSTPSGPVKLTSLGTEEHAGINTDHLHASTSGAASKQPGTITVDQLRVLNGGRLPVGVDATRAPGPYTAVWGGGGSVDAFVRGGHLIDATSTQSQVVTVSGGGLGTSRTITVDDGATLPNGDKAESASWKVQPAHVQHAAAQIQNLPTERADRNVWRHVVPGALVCFAGFLIFLATRRRTPKVERRSAPSSAPDHSGAHVAS